jgi:hypothetical protein
VVLTDHLRHVSLEADRADDLGAGAGVGVLADELHFDR